MAWLVLGQLRDACLSSLSLTFSFSDASRAGSLRNVRAQRVWRGLASSESSNLLEFPDITIAISLSLSFSLSTMVLSTVAVIFTVGFRPEGGGRATTTPSWLIHALLPVAHLTEPDGLVGSRLIYYTHHQPDYHVINFAHYSAVWVLRAAWLDPPVFSPPPPQPPGSHVTAVITRLFRHIPSAVCHLPHFPPPVSTHRPQTSLSSYSRDLSNANVGWRLARPIDSKRQVLARQERRATPGCQLPRHATASRDARSSCCAAMACIISKGNHLRSPNPFLFGPKPSPGPSATYRRS